MGKDLMNCGYYEDREKNYSLLLDVYEKKPMDSITAILFTIGYLALRYFNFFLTPSLIVIF